MIMLYDFLVLCWMVSAMIHDYIYASMNHLPLESLAFWFAEFDDQFIVLEPIVHFLAMVFRAIGV